MIFPGGSGVPQSNCLLKKNSLEDQSNIVKCFNIYGCKIHNLKVGSVPIVLLPILLIQARRVYCEVCNNAIQS